MPEHDRRTEKRVDLVFEGGGVKGIGLVGAVQALLERGYRPVNMAGSSAGSIVAALLAADYGPDELRDTIAGLDYSAFQDRAWEDRIPLVDRPLSLLLDQGLYEGGALHAWVAERLEARGVVTFGDLVLEEFADDSRYRHRLQVIASDVTGRRLLVLPRDAARLGIDPDRLSVALAVRMSTSIPIFFEPVRLLSAADGREHLIVDGGMLSNFPVWLFDADGVPEWPTFGLLLVEPESRTPVAARLAPPERRAPAIVDYVRSLAQTMMEAHDRLYVEEANFARTIAIPTLGVRTTEFDLSHERALALAESGRAAAEAFLASWDFDAYVASFRSGERDGSRRQRVHDAMRQAASASSPSAGATRR